MQAALNNERAQIPEQQSEVFYTPMGVMPVEIAGPTSGRSEAKPTGATQDNSGSNQVSSDDVDDTSVEISDDTSVEISDETPVW